jgi:hypothetical protein
MERGNAGVVLVVLLVAILKLALGKLRWCCCRVK